VGLTGFQNEISCGGVHMRLPTPVTAHSKAWICGRSLAWIMGSNSAEGVEIFLLKMLYFVK
jgi:hypothetical protein